MEYGIGITNRYAFLDDDVDDIAVAVVEPKKKTPAVVPPVKDKKKVLDKSNNNNKKIDKPPPPKPKENPKEKEVDKEAVAAVPPKTEGYNNSPRRYYDRGTRIFFRGNRNARGDGDRDKENYEGDSRGNYHRGGGSRGGRGGYAAGETSTFRDDWGEGGPTTESPYREYDNGGGRGGRGGGRGFGRGGSNNYGFTRRRDFDRASGSDRSGIKPMDKRNGAGAHNWGTYKDEVCNDPQSRSDELNFNGESEADPFATENGQGDSTGLDNNGMNTESIETESWTQPSTETDSDMNGLEIEEKEEVEPKTITLEEWKAMQQPKPSPNFNIRQPNEGEDPTKWNNLVLKKKENLDDSDEVIYEEEDIWVPQRAGRQKLITGADIGFHFAREDREEKRIFRGRGGGGYKESRERSGNGNGDAEASVRGAGYRGRGRGGRGRGLSRGGFRGREHQGPRDIPRTDDLREWPSLMC